MKIRDIRQYIKELCKNETLDLIGKDNEEWFKYVYGPNKKLDASITEAATFATNAEEQLFYEFVQNAFDAKADSLYFFFNENYLIVLNNGVPFYTDLDLETNPDHREGQLYTFLSKNKSDKYGDSHKMGEHGQGSKLLYTLLTDLDEWKDNSSLLLDAIKKQKKGPTLISWSSRAQIANLCFNDGTWEPSQVDNDKEFPLFIKILYSYYPIMPGQSEKLFPKHEVAEVLRVFDEMVQPRRSKSFMDQGSALIIPLGKGKYEKINSKANLDKVMRGLGGFVSLTNANKYSDGRDIEHIYIQGKEIDMLKVESMKIEFTKGDTEFLYVFGFNPDFATKNFVNFYKGLPIIESQLKLGFIIDSQSFGIDNSRQRIITEKEKVENQLTEAFTILKKQLLELKDTNRELFTYIYKSLAYSSIYNIPDSASYVKGAFRTVFVPFFKEYYLSLDGNFYKAEDVINPAEEDEDYRLPLESIGVSKHWASPDISAKLHTYLGIDVQNLTIDEVLELSDEEDMTEWIKSLSEDDYKSYHNYCLRHLEGIEEFSLFRSNNNNVYSYDEITGDDNILYCTDTENVVYNDIEYIVEPLLDIAPDDYYRSLYGKLKKNVASYRTSNARKDTAIHILVKTEELCSDLKSGIASQIPLFQNWNGEFKPFDNLLIERPKGTTLFDVFRVKGYLPSEVKKSWFIQPEVDGYKTWTWILNNIESIKAVDGWKEYAKTFIKDLKTAYKNSISEDHPKDNTRLIQNFYIDSNGCPSTTPCVGLQNKLSLKSDEYELVIKTFPEYNFISDEFYKDITSDPFIQSNVSTKDLISSVGTVDINVLSILIKISPSFLTSFWVKEMRGNYSIKEKSYEQYNYIYDNMEESLRLKLESIGLYSVPVAVQELIPSVRTNNEFSLIKNSKLMELAISKFDNKLLLLPLVKDCNSDVIKLFFDSIPYIEISSELSEEDERWKVIKFGGDRSDSRLIVFNKIRFNSNSLPANIKQRYFKVDSNEYDVYLLDEDIKNDNQSIEAFFGCLPSKDCETWFRRTFYANKEEAVNTDVLYNKLLRLTLDVNQVKFMLDICRLKNIVELPFKLNLSAPIKSVLDMALEYKFEKIDNIVNIPGFNKTIQVYANKQLLTSEELLPEEIFKWIELHDNGLTVFSHIMTVAHPLISLRDALVNNIYMLPKFDSYESGSEREMLNRTIQWLVNKNLKIEYLSDRYSVCRAISERLPKDFHPYYSLKFNGEIDSTNDGAKMPLFTFAPCPKGSAFLSALDITSSIIDKLRDSQPLRNFIKSSNVFLFNSENELWTRGLMPSPVWKISSIVDEKGYDEWEDSVYEKWKNTEESKGITIKLSNRPVEVNLAILSGEEKVYQEKSKNSDFGYIWDKLVVIKYQQEQDKSVIKKLSSTAAEIEFFRQPFIHLQSMYIDELENVSAQKIAEAEAAIAAAENGIQIADDELVIKKNPEVSEDKIQDVIDNITEEAADKIESLNEIANNFDEDEIKDLIDNMDKVKQILDDVIEEEKESQVRQTIGFIGELIYSHYLENKKLVKDKDFVHAALDGVGEYDFEIKPEKMFVDVKTTLYSLKDGTAPFYLHRSQNVFMQKHPDSKYHIVRISLIDLNLKKSYEELRDTYGKDANPLENPRLKKRCEDVAKRYWRGAKIEEFDALSPEYAIRIEQKINK